MIPQTPVFSLSSLSTLRSVHVICVEAEGLIVAHQVVVVLRDGEHVWVHQHARLVGVEGGEHLADSWDPDLPLVEHSPFLCEEDAVGDGGVGVCVRVVVQADHVALGDEVEEDGGEEGEEADEATESDLQGEALDSESGLEENVGHEEETGPTGAIREHLHPSDSGAQIAVVNQVPLLGVARRRETTGRWTSRLHRVYDAQRTSVSTRQFTAQASETARGTRHYMSRSRHMKVTE